MFPCLHPKPTVDSGGQSPGPNKRGFFLPAGCERRHFSKREEAARGGDFRGGWGLSPLFFLISREAKDIFWGRGQVAGKGDLLSDVEQNISLSRWGARGKNSLP